MSTSTKAKSAERAAFEQRDERYRPPQAAAYLGKSVQTLAIWRCTGRYGLPYVRNGGTIEYLKKDLDEFLEGRKVQPKLQEL